VREAAPPAQAFAPPAGAPAGGGATPEAAAAPDGGNEGANATPDRRLALEAPAGDAPTDTQVQPRGDVASPAYLASSAAAFAAAGRGPRTQAVDPTVSKAKFDAEVRVYQRHEAAHRARGWLLHEAEFPTVFLALAAPQLKPAPLVFGLLLDFTNYDVEPPSLLLVDPLTKRPLATRELATNMPRRQAARIEVAPVPDAPAASEVPAAQEPEEPVVPAAPAPEAIVNLAPPIALLQDSPSGFPFLCLEGIYEYHQHPAHSGNDWLLHRARGAGTLQAILGVFETYAVRPLVAYHIGARMNFVSQQNQPMLQQILLQVNGFVVSEPPA
jgi:hypothetical protein